MRIADRKILSELLARLQETPIGNEVLSASVWKALAPFGARWNNEPHFAPDLTRNATAALTLFGNILPRWFPTLRQDGAGGFWLAYAGHSDLRAGLTSQPCATPAIAVTAAVIVALLHEAGEAGR